MKKKRLIHLFQEIGMLSDTTRSGFAFLGSGKQSVAEHSYRMTLIAYYLAEESGLPLDKEKLLLMCLFHDLPEARTADHNYVNKRYVSVNEERLYEDYAALPWGNRVIGWLKEYDASTSNEAKIAHDADQLELLCVLKKEWDLGNKAAEQWFENVFARLITPVAIELAKELKKTPFDEWWKFED